MLLPPSKTTATAYLWIPEKTQRVRGLLIMCANVPEHKLVGHPAIREVCEEMGVRAPIEVRGELGTIRYGFCTPDGSPRLKTIYLYVLEASCDVGAFDPATGEGIDAVRWFALEEALASLAHPSLRASIGRLLGALEERAAELGLKMAAV